MTDKGYCGKCKLRGKKVVFLLRKKEGNVVFAEVKWRGEFRRYGLFMILKVEGNKMGTLCCRFMVNLKGCKITNNVSVHIISVNIIL